MIQSKWPQTFIEDNYNYLKILITIFIVFFTLRNQKINLLFNLISSITFKANQHNIK